MSARLLYLSAASALVISACATSQENPNYKYSTQYKAATPYQTASHNQGTATTVVTQPAAYTTTSQPVTYVTQQPTQTYAAPQSVVYTSSVQPQSTAPIIYQSTQAPAAIPANYARVDQNCLRKESNRQLLGGAIGGTVGALAGKELVGGTKGTLIGAAIGGTAGYGVGNMSVNCGSAPANMTQASSVTTQSPYQPHQPQYQYQQPQTTTQYGQTYSAATSMPAAPQVQQMPAPQLQLPPVNAPQPAASQTYTAPTDQAYGDTIGTPGYHAVMAAPLDVQPQAQAQLPALPQPQAPAYTAPQPTYTLQPEAYLPQQPQYAPAQPTYQGQSAMAGNLHQVVEGDTVYSISRRLCATPEDIQRLNGLNANFNIKLGEQIRLPASRC